MLRAERAAYDAHVQAQLDREELERAVAAACRAGDATAAVTQTIRGYGSELLAFLGVLARDAALAEAAFAVVGDELGRGLPAFRWDVALRTWCYALARGAWLRLAEAGGGAQPLPSSPLDAVIAEVRTATAAQLRSEVACAVAMARDAVDDDDQVLLVLRGHRAMQWPDIARILADEPLERAEVLRRAVALRHRFLELRDRPRPAPRGPGDAITT